MFQGKKVRLRAYLSSEYDRVWGLINDGAVLETLLVGPVLPLSFESEKAYLNSVILNTKEEFHFAIETIRGGEVIGGCGINSIDRKNSVATIGIWIGKEFQGMGYGSDAIRTLSAFIFEELNINKVRLEYFDFNQKSPNCYKAAGFVEEGRKRKEIYRYGEYHDIIIMGLFRDELKR